MSDRGRSAARSPGGPPSGPPSRTQSPAMPAPLGYDPGRSNTTEKPSNSRVELPPDAYTVKKGAFTLRNGKFNTEGTPDTIAVNQYRMTSFDSSKKIFQYDVQMSPDDRKIPYRKIFESPQVKTALAPYKPDLWLYDGKKLAWGPSRLDRGEVRIEVDIDAQSRLPGVPPKPGSVFRVTIRLATEIDLSVLRSYLDQKQDSTSEVIQAMNFMDHLIRQGPSQRFVSIKRNFYDATEKGRPLLDGRLVEVHKGAYISIRPSNNPGGRGLALNCDIANTSFWVSGQSLDNVACTFLANCSPQWSNIQPATSLGQALRPVNKGGSFESSDAFKQLRKLRRLKFTIKHHGRTTSQVYTIQDFMFSQNLGPEGGSARNVKFDFNGKMTSVFDYYQQKYKVTLRYSNLPLIDAGKGGAIPMELAFIEPMQRYMFKLNGKQTDAMIKIAVTRPNVRRADIENKVQSLGLNNDPCLRHYGVQFETKFAQTDAKVLPAPSVDFRQGQQKPGFNGRWRLDQGTIKFWKPNSMPLKSWGLIVLDGCVPGPAPLEAFVSKFRQIFARHGGNVPENGVVLNVPGQIRSNGAEAIAWAHQQLLAKKGYPQLLFIVVGFKNSPHYERLKKSADCRFGILSQVVVNTHVTNDGGNAQYISNVCMKVNAKLGGATARTASPFGKIQTYFPPNRKTMMIGVDVSHAAPGGNNPSVAAMTMSCDPDANRFAAAVETNGYRVEMVKPANMQAFMSKLGNIWRNGHANAAPDHIIYFRDGVAENQFVTVLDCEIREIRRFFEERKVKVPKITVIVATKRHHIRFFPGPDQRNRGGDQNGNPKPGVLVEKEVTHPFMWDFYLNSHKAIQGTSRPVHYYVIHDEMNCPVNDLQRMIYHQCYSYARSTTPVSIHPAIYYAHLAGARARHHENAATSDGFRAGGKGHELLRDKIAKGQTIGASHKDDESPPLLELGGTVRNDQPMPADEKAQRLFIKQSMWYI